MKMKEVGALFLLCSLLLLSGSPLAQASKEILSVAHIDIMPSGVTKLEGPIKTYLAASEKDPGKIEIHLGQEIGRPNHFTLVEIWASRQAFDAHVASKATRDFHASLAPYLGSPYDERLHSESLEFNP